VYTRRDVHLTLDRADLVLGAPVGSLLVDRDSATDDLLLERREGSLD